MCTLVLSRRPGHDWPILIAANRDEMAGRPWKAPARHWPDRPEVTAGLDELAQGSWLGMNDHGVVAAILNRVGTLGPAPGKRSRGELVLDALDHADADQAAQALADLDGRAWRPFNMIVADNRDAFWAKSDGTGLVHINTIPPGLHMISAMDLDDSASPRLAAYLPRFRAAPPARPRPWRLAGLAGADGRWRRRLGHRGNRRHVLPAPQRLRHRVVVADRPARHEQRTKTLVAVRSGTTGQKFIFDNLDVRIMLLCTGHWC